MASAILEPEPPVSPLLRCVRQMDVVESILAEITDRRPMTPADIESEIKAIQHRLCALSDQAGTIVAGDGLNAEALGQVREGLKATSQGLEAIEWNVACARDLTRLRAIAARLRNAEASNA